jgi:hypothetical protein
MLKRFQILAVLTAFALAAAGPASAGAKSRAHPLHFTGKTKEGDKVSFVLDGHWVDKLQTILPETCISAQGGTPKVDRFVWAIPYKYWVGYTVKVKYGSPTTYYTITTHRKGNRITGKLSANYSLLGTDGFGDYVIWHCLATANFNLVGK